MSSRYQKLATNEQEQSMNEGPSTTTQQRADLQDSFGFDEEDEHEPVVTDRLLVQQPYELQEDDNDDDNNSIEMMRPTQTTTSNHSRNIAPAVLPVSNDGVFANMSAKPESESKKLEETPPTYEEAAADATPPYWQTTIIAPAGMGDIILVEGMPVGSIFAFFWNLLISASFQVVGFMLTYLLHTSHASKDGALAGLGVSLVQTGFYIRSRGTLEDDGYEFDDGDDKSSTEGDSPDVDILAYLIMMLGWFIIIRSLADYFRAKQMEKIICSEPTAESMV